MGLFRRLRGRPKLNIDESVLVTTKCSEPGCDVIGKYLTADPLESALKKHYCLAHNKRICFSSGIGQ